MQAQATIARKGVEPFLEQFSVHLTDLWALKMDVPNQIRPVGQVNRGARKGLVHRDIGVAKATDACKVAQSAFEGLAHHDASVFNRVVHIDMQIALGLNCQINQRMLGKAFQHMVKKANAGRNFGNACPIQIHGDRDLCLFRIALKGGRSHDEIFPLLDVVSLMPKGASGPLLALWEDKRNWRSRWLQSASAAGRLSPRQPNVCKQEKLFWDIVGVFAASRTFRRRI
jgi:hypothetical protein